MGFGVGDQVGWVPIVREPALQRLAAAERAVLAEFQTGQQVPRGTGLVAGAASGGGGGGRSAEYAVREYARAALRADDDHGQAAGLVVQGDELPWADVELLVRLAGQLVDAGAHGGVGTWHPGCPDCAAVVAIGRIRARERYRTVTPTGRDQSRPT